MQQKFNSCYFMIDLVISRFCFFYFHIQCSFVYFRFFLIICRQDLIVFIKVDYIIMNFAVNKENVFFLYFLRNIN